jgi:tRNA modification GTPase
VEFDFWNMSQTIVALATPYGRSGIGVIRLSGALSLEIVRKLSLDSEFNPPPRRSILKKIFDLETSELIDETLITFFQAPNSFTGEDVIEISCHGSPILLRQIIDFCLKLDVRLAQAGEFSLRALANGRMNLSQAEAIRDLIDAQTVASARQAVRQLGGELSNQLQPLKDDLLNIIVILESTLEFVEDDLPDFQTEKILDKLTEIAFKLGEIGSTFRVGRLLREGLKVGLIGRPNVGKSSLFNNLIGQERAIVTDIPGTTRDSLYEALSIQGIPISLIDTAGIRETTDKVERMGVDRTKMVIADSDLIIVVLDNSHSLTGEDKQVLEAVQGLTYLIAVNKIDLEDSELDLNELSQESKIVKISAKLGKGFEELQNAIVEPFLPDDSSSSGFFVSDARHYDLLSRSKIEIETSYVLMETKNSEEIVLIGLHNAIRLLGEVTGETTTEDMLTRIFSTFCIGK